jgi:SAM-dependent methyltransferase
MSDYVQRLREHFGPLLETHGTSHRALDWGSAASQQRRFDALLDVLDTPGLSVLDVGCGLGDLAAALDAREHTGAYLGVDALPEMIERARACRPDRRFEVAVGGGAPLPKADVVMASGLLTVVEGLAAAHATIDALYAACTYAMAINSLSTWGPSPVAGEHPLDPLETIAFCRTLTPWVVLRHDYLPHDFTIYCYRSARG